MLCACFSLWIPETAGRSLEVAGEEATLRAGGEASLLSEETTVLAEEVDVQTGTAYAGAKELSFTGGKKRRPSAPELDSSRSASSNGSGPRTPPPSSRCVPPTPPKVFSDAADAGAEALAAEEGAL